MNRLCCDNIEVVGEEYNASDPYLNLAKNVICRGHNSSKLGPEIVLQNCVPHGHHGSGAIWASWIRCHMGIMDQVPYGHHGSGAIWFHGSGATLASWIGCHVGIVDQVQHRHHGSGAIWASWIRCHMGIMDQVPYGHHGSAAIWFHGSGATLYILEGILSVISHEL